MTTANDIALFPVTRRLNVCCPHAECTCHADGIRLLTKHGIMSEFGVDEDGHHFLEFSLPFSWSLKKRRRFNERLNRRIDSERHPCDYCGNMMYTEAVLITCSGCGERSRMCSECCIAGIDPDFCECE